MDEHIERSPYSPIIDRKPFRLPGNARVAVWAIVNVEKWDIRNPMPRPLVPPPGGGTVVPDIPNYSWYDYGLRVGFWRIKRILDKHGIKGVMCGAIAPRWFDAARIEAISESAGSEFWASSFPGGSVSSLSSGSRTS